MRVKTKHLVSRALLILAGYFIALGIYRGGVSTVLTKAVNICLECIGLG